METELTLHVAQPDMSRLREHHLLVDPASKASVEHQIIDTYYDTPELNLWHSGLMLYVREDAGAWTQTVKTRTPGSAGASRRGEWESALPGPDPDPAQLARQIKPKAISELLRAPGLGTALSPVFKSTTRRVTWDIVLPDGRHVECALDAGDIQVGERSASISELGLDLKRGDPTQLFELALALHHEIPLQISSDSQAASGYALLDREPPQPAKAVAPRLTNKMSLERAFQCLGLNCLRQVEANLAGVLKQDVESLHQMRVGLRRLRALLGMFGELAPLPGDIQASLDWLTGELGAARDWDVLAGSTLSAVAGPDSGALRQAAEQKRDALHRAVLQTLNDPRYTQLILQLNGWLHGRQWRNGVRPAKDSPLACRAAVAMRPMLRRAQRRLRKRADTIDQADPAGRHRVRIAAKKARYAAEFFHDLLPGKRVKRYIRTLSALQDQLGHLNDLGVAHRLLEELQEPRTMRDIAYAQGYIAGNSEADGRHLGPSLDAVARLKLLD